MNTDTRYYHENCHENCHESCHKSCYQESHLLTTSGLVFSKIGSFDVLYSAVICHLCSSYLFKNLHHKVSALDCYIWLLSSYANPHEVCIQIQGVTAVASLIDGVNYVWIWSMINNDTT